MVEVERPLRLSPGAPVHLTVYVDDSLCEIYVNESVALSTRMYDHAEGDCSSRRAALSFPTFVSLRIEFDARPDGPTTALPEGIATVCRALELGINYISLIRMRARRRRAAQTRCGSHPVLEMP